VAYLMGLILEFLIKFFILWESHQYGWTKNASDVGRPLSARKTNPVGALRKTG